MTNAKKSTAKKRACTCIQKVNEELEQFNTRIQWAFDMKGRLMAPIETVKINPRGKRARLLVASFCPFCGRKYTNT